MTDKKFYTLIAIIIFSNIIQYIHINRINTSLEYIENKATEGWVDNRILIHTLYGKYNEIVCKQE